MFCFDYRLEIVVFLVVVVFIIFVHFFGSSLQCDCRWLYYCRHLSKVIRAEEILLKKRQNPSSFSK